MKRVLLVELTKSELLMLRHAMRIGAEDGSLIGSREDDRLYDRVVAKLTAALHPAPAQRDKPTGEMK